MSLADLNPFVTSPLLTLHTFLRRLTTTSIWTNTGVVAMVPQRGLSFGCATIENGGRQERGVLRFIAPGISRRRSYRERR